MRRTNFALAPLGVLLASLALPVAADTSWAFTCTGASCDNSGGSNPAYGNTRTATATVDGTEVTVTASAYANTKNSSNTVLETAYLSWWNDGDGNAPPTGGLGVTNRDKCTSSSSCGDYNEGSSPEHAMDNEQRWDAILFSFSEAINLTQIGLSWYSNDADISVLAYQPGTIGGTAYADPATPILADGSTTYAGLTTLAEGWSLVGNYADLQQRTNMTASLGTDKVSSHWLVMAYNTAAFASYGCNDGTANSGWNNSVKSGIDGCTNGGNHSYSPWDYMKVGLLGGTTIDGGGGGQGNAPEPGTVLLLGAGFAGLSLARRRKAAA